MAITIRSTRVSRCAVACISAGRCCKSTPLPPAIPSEARPERLRFFIYFLIRWACGERSKNGMGLLSYSLIPSIVESFGHKIWDGLPHAQYVILMRTHPRVARGPRPTPVTCTPAARAVPRPMPVTCTPAARAAPRRGYGCPALSAARLDIDWYHQSTPNAN